MKGTDKVIIIGGKGTALNIAEQIITAREQFGAPVELIGWAIDDPSLGASIIGFPVLCKTTQVLDRYPQPEIKFVFALYKPGKMRERVALLESYGIPPTRFFSFVHPLASVARTARLGSGTVVFSHSTINSNVVVGSHTIINANVVIEHGSVIGDNNFLAAAACIGADVRLGRGVFVGLNATIREQVTVGEFAFIGMGSNVVSSLESDQIAYGNPARPR